MRLIQGQKKEEDMKGQSEEICTQLSLAIFLFLNSDQDQLYTQMGRSEGLTNVGKSCNETQKIPSAASLIRFSYLGERGIGEEEEYKGLKIK